MKRIAAALALSVLLAFTLCGCVTLEQIVDFFRRSPQAPASSQSSQPESEPVDVNFPASVGGVSIEQKPERVISLNPAITELIYDLGLEAVLVGDSEYCDYPAAAQTQTRCGSELMPDIGAISGRGAELVLTLSPLPKSAEQALAEKNILLITLKKPDSIEALPEFYTELCTALLGREAGKEAAERFYTPLLERYNASTLAAGGASARPISVFVAILPATLATGDSFQGALLEKCGMENAARNNANWQYPDDLLISLEPELLILDSRTTSAEAVMAHPNYKTTACVKNDKILPLDGAALENRGLRMFEAIDTMIAFAHPELKTDEDEGEGEAESEEPTA